MTPSSVDIAIVGMAGRFPGARNIDEYWRNLRDGVESVRRYSDDELHAAGVDDHLLRDPNYVPAGAPLDDMESFDAGYFGFNTREGDILDPQHRHFLECSCEALEHAGHVPKSFPGLIGLFAGSGHNAYLPYNLLTNAALVRSVGLFLLRHTGNDKDFLTTRVSYLLDLRGPSLNVQTACSTSLVAVHLASQSLLNGECDMALAGGVTIELPHRHGYRYEEGEILAPDGHCRAFDAASAGTVFGSGVGVVVLRRLDEAIADGDTVYAVVKGTAVNNDGNDKVGYLAPSVGGQARAIAEALAVSGVPADAISYVETHGTGTPVGDPIEIAALTQAFRESTDREGFCGIGSVKTNIGHLDTAAGVASLIKVVQSLRHEEIPASLHFERPNPALALEGSPFRVVASRTPWPATGVPRRAGVSSLGVGGTNAHAVIEEAPPEAATQAAREWQILPVSGRTALATDAAAANLAGYLASHPSISLGDAAWTLQVGRTHHAIRRFVVAPTVTRAESALRTPPAGAAPALRTGRTLAFLFAGGGAQHAGMGRDLDATEAVYRDAVDECLGLAEPKFADQLRALLRGTEDRTAEIAEQLERPSLGLPALFIAQYACARLWISWGVTPTAMIGHSMGEYTAAHFAGVFSLADALALVTLRGKLFERVPQGAMLGVPLSAEALRPLLGDSLSLAAENAPGLSVASGPRAAIDALERQLATREIDCMRIRIAVAAHSFMLEPILEEFGAFLERTRLSSPVTPFLSNVSGTWITTAEATDPKYWVRHLRQTVRFAEGVGALLANPSQVCLEVGPGRTLTSLARLHPHAQSGHVFVPSLRRADESDADHATMLTALGRLWQSGVDVDWRAVQRGATHRRIALPTYPFQRERHWIEPGAVAPGAGEAATITTGRHADIGDWFWEPTWVRARTPPRASPGESVLLIANPGPLLEGLVQRLTTAGSTCVVATEGASCVERGAQRWILNPSDASHVEAVLRSMSDGGRPATVVVHLLTLGESAFADPDAALTAACFSAMALGRAVSVLDPQTPLRLVAVGSGLFDVAGEGVADPRKATLAGVMRVIPAEVSGVTTSTVDVALPDAGSRLEAEALDSIVAEVLAPAGNGVVALRGADRWSEEFVPSRRDRVLAQHSRVRARGRYVVTGGLGGIGLTVARHLASTAQARLALIGRTALPPREEWQRVLQSAADDAIAARIRSVMAMEADGAEVLTIAADVSEEAQVRSALESVRLAYGGIDGVFHAAGVLDDGLLALKELESARRVLAPKVAGALALGAALVPQETDFVVLFSSVSAFAGLAGQADYAAANAFLDGFARHLRRTRAIPTVAVNWSAWRDVGMVSGGSQRAGREREAVASEPVSPPYPFFEGRRTTADATIFAARLSAARHWLLGEHRVRGGDALIPGTGFLELARAAFERATGTREVELVDVVFASPFAVAGAEERDLEVRLLVAEAGATRAPGEAEFVVMGRGVGEAEWTEHVRGSIAGVAPAGLPAPAVSLAELRARCSERVVVARGQRMSAHLEFGPRWDSVEEIAYGDGVALISLRLPDAYASDLESFGMHPSLLDMATAGAQRLIAGFDPESDFLVPVSYGRVVLHRSLCARVLSVVTLKAGSGRDSATFDVRVVDDEGRLLLVAEDFTMIRVRSGEQLQAHQRGVDAPSSGAAATGVKAYLVDAIRPAEGVEALDRILSGPLPERVIVAPVPLPALLESLRQSASPAPSGTSSAPREPAGRDLGHVAEALLKHEAVADAVVADRRDQSGETRPVAWVAFKPGEQATASELRRHLRTRVSEDSVAHAFVEVERIARVGTAPDWSALASPFGEAEATIAPRTPMEQVIADIWCELLGAPGVGVRDNFFDIGGHSLLSVRFIARLHRKVNLRLLHEDIVVHTLEQLAAKLDAMAPARAG